MLGELGYLIWIFLSSVVSTQMTTPHQAELGCLYYLARAKEDFIPYSYRHVIKYVAEYVVNWLFVWFVYLFV